MGVSWYENFRGRKPRGRALPITSVRQPEFPPLVARTADRPQSILSLPSRRISHALGSATRLAHSEQAGGVRCCRHARRVLQIGRAQLTTAALRCRIAHRRPDANAKSSGVIENISCEAEK